MKNHTTPAFGGQAQPPGRVAGYSMQTGVNIGGTVSSKDAIQGNFATAGVQAIYTDRPTREADKAERVATIRAM